MADSEFLDNFCFFGSDRKIQLQILVMVLARDSENTITSLEIGVVIVVVLLAATAQNRCTALVWSCYAPSRGFNNKGTEESINNTNTNTNTNTKKLSQAEKEDGVMEEVSNHSNETQSCCESASNGHNNGTRSGSNGPYNLEPTCLKSNLKKTVVKENQNQNQNQSRTVKRKVSWPDAHGKDIAHIQEFDPSVSEDGELEGVRNSCICAIQ